MRKIVITISYMFSFLYFFVALIFNDVFNNIDGDEYIFWEFSKIIRTSNYDWNVTVSQSANFFWPLLLSPFVGLGEYGFFIIILLKLIIFLVASNYFLNTIYLRKIDLVFFVPIWCLIGAYTATLYRDDLVFALLLLSSSFIIRKHYYQMLTATIIVISLRIASLLVLLQVFRFRLMHTLVLVLFFVFIYLNFFDLLSAYAKFLLNRLSIGDVLFGFVRSFVTPVYWHSSGILDRHYNSILLIPLILIKCIAIITFILRRRISRLGSANVTILAIGVLSCIPYLLNHESIHIRGVLFYQFSVLCFLNSIRWKSF